MKNKLSEVIMGNSMECKVRMNIEALYLGGRKVKRENLIRDLVTECLNEIEPGYYIPELKRRDIVVLPANDIIEVGHNMICQPTSFTLNKIETDYIKRRPELKSAYYFCHIITVITNIGNDEDYPMTYLRRIRNMKPGSIEARLSIIEKIAQHFDPDCIFLKITEPYKTSMLELNFFIGEIKPNTLN